MCKNCTEKNMIKTKCTYVVDADGKLTIVRNVPCTECLHCGEHFYSDDVAGKLEKYSIKSSKSAKEINISDYSKIA